jgi:predicted nucleic acid-binding protein
MGEVICFDTTPLIWGVRGESTRGQEQEIEKTRAYIRYLRDAHKQIMIPSPVVSEYLIGASATELHELEVLKRGFQIPSFDLPSAILAAKLQRGDTIKILQEDFDLDRECIKVDAQIIAIAIINHAVKIITNNDKHFKVLARGRIPISGVPDTERQLGLDLPE